MSYTPGTGGRVQVAVPDGSTVSVTITALSGKSIVVYSDAARTASVSMPNSATVPTAYYVRSDDVYQVSCLVGGVECAVQGSTTGVATVDLRGDQTCSIGVDSEFAQNSGGGGSDLPTPTTGDAGKVVTVNDGEDGYELDVPGGASGPFLHVVFPFAFDAAGLTDGVEVTGWTPAAGDVLYSAWLDRPTAWDGTTPSGELFFGTDTQGVAKFLSGNPYLYDMTAADIANNSGSVTVVADYGSFIPGVGEPGYTITVQTGSGPLHIAVSQDGTRGGDDPGSTQGSAVLHLLIVPAA